MSPSQIHSQPSPRSAHGSWMTPAHPHDACGHAAVRDARHLVLRHREPGRLDMAGGGAGADVAGLRYRSHRAFERWHAGAMIATLLELSGARQLDPAYLPRTRRRRRLGGDHCRRSGWFLSHGRSGPGRRPAQLFVRGRAIASAGAALVTAATGCRPSRARAPSGPVGKPGPMRSFRLSSRDAQLARPRPASRPAWLRSSPDLGAERLLLRRHRLPSEAGCVDCRGPPSERLRQPTTRFAIDGCRSCPPAMPEQVSEAAAHTPCLAPRTPRAPPDGFATLRRNPFGMQCQ
jgi:hypothetical protein